LLTVVAWKWRRNDGTALFGPEYVNRTRAALELHLAIPHEVVCVTDDPAGIDRRVRIVPIPMKYAHTPRCRRRMQVFSRDFAERHLGPRILTIDLDVVIVGNITPIVDRAEPFVGWKVGYAGVYSGSFHLHDAGYLDSLWRAFEADPAGFPGKCSRERVPSDQAMLNAHFAGVPVPHWTEADGFVSYFGQGYERLEHLGVGPHQTTLPDRARVVVLGSADKTAMDYGADHWIREHWSALPGEARA